jgi:molybdopterin synthase catalytic subunit
MSSPSYLQPAEVNFLYITEQPIDLSDLLAQSHHPKAGAVVLFSGEVRDHNAGKEVGRLEYEAHVPMASKMIKEILEEATQKWQLNIAVAQHRIGTVEIGESAVVVITASSHRKEAYAANRFIIDKIKHEVPIWKCEVYADGTKEWGNNCNCHSVTGSPDKHIYESAEQSS